jgi:hypothetical protein
VTQNASRGVGTVPIFRKLGTVAALFLAGGVCGAGVHYWIGGLGRQHAQLEQCVLGWRNSHPKGDANSTLASLEEEVPQCMDRAGYSQALDNLHCGPAPWQGNVYCYLPKSFVGRLIYRIEARSESPREG